MLLRTVVLLFLCLSTGMCATLGLYQAQAQEEEAPAVTDGVAAFSVDATEEAVAPADTEEAVAPADTKVDSPADEEPAADSISDDSLLGEILAADNPEAGKPEVEVPVPDGETAEEPEPESDRPTEDAPATETPADEAVTQEEPSSDNEIRPVQTNQSLSEPLVREEASRWSINSIRSGVQSMHGYFDSLVELVGGYNGQCQYRCRHGDLPIPRPGYQLPEPNGCSSSLVGFQLDMGIPAMTNCCNQLDVCYDTCGTSKEDCDGKFQMCLYDICFDIKKSLGFVSEVQACESMADALHSTVGTLGCRPYMNSQRAACVCAGEERDEL
ncbi:group XIIB secretory phospholipase A2-like protein isoform X2 [Centropristis striata]|uniref:group XIIB secretory phospholipase A2-like protein isoform X2 n=1 Tax=Centropristis striata TaxID=184440 RepID=UPI0027E10304|nr:group XIIB secretory phospholipase A2-like protein isoform X2 [Centropristis striata]